MLCPKPPLTPQRVSQSVACVLRFVRMVKFFPRFLPDPYFYIVAAAAVIEIRIARTSFVQVLATSVRSRRGKVE